MFNLKQYTVVQKECFKHKAQLLAVSKKRSVAELKDLYAAGQRMLGENRVQDLLEKKDSLPSDIAWHLIGHLQRNKVKYIAPFISMIHAVDSLKLAQEINKEAKKNNRVIDCLLQFHVAKEESKHGITPTVANDFLKEFVLANFTNIRLRGVMGMASFTDDDLQVSKEFKLLNSIYNELKNSNLVDIISFDTLSMGMSGDYSLALKEGSTMVRVGSKLFTN